MTEETYTESEEVEENGFTAEEQTLMEEHQLSELEYLEMASVIQGYIRDYGTDAIDAVYKQAREDFLNE